MKPNLHQLLETPSGIRIPRQIAMLCLLLIVFVMPMRADGAGKKANKSNSEPILKVLMGSIHKNIKIEFPQGGQMQNRRGRRIKSFARKSAFNWALPSDKRRKSKPQYSGETMLLTGTGNIISLNGKTYRGSMQVEFSAKGARVINLVGIEDYLRGVVGSEIGSRSPAESLKAQTVIARTYAYASRGKHGSDGADVCNSTHCQVYSGVSAERDTIDPAVAGTRGVIMISDGEPIATLYHASCGGMTSDNDKVFGGAPRSYLRRVICPFCKNGTNYRWSRSISLADLRAALIKEKVSFTRLFDVSIESAGHMDRADNLVLHTNTGVHKVRGTTIRRLFNLPSTTFVTGSRKLPGQIIAAAKPMEVEPAAARANQLSIRIAALASDAGAGPQQLFIQSAAGLRRITRPEGGWHTIGMGSENLATASAPSPAATEKTVSNSSDQPLDKLEIFGRGYGHQVGLCQSGAIELGKRNWSYRQILAFYYSNVALRSLDY